MDNYTNSPSIVICYQAPELEEKASALARTLGLPCIPAEKLDTTSAQLVLRFNLDGQFDYRLELQSREERMTPIRVDFDSDTLVYRQKFGGGRRQAIGRAIGLQSNSQLAVIDATAGLGKDAFVLASLGCKVIMLERNPVIAALLEDGLRRYRLSYPEIASRMHLDNRDSKEFLHAIDASRKIDCIYLDPMYPHRRKSALVKKEMRILRQVVGDDKDISDLLNTALGCPVNRVVVKRPSSAPVINAMTQPSHAISTKNTRFDVYCNLPFA